MGLFINNLIVEDIDGKNWILRETFKWQSNDGNIITITPGFITDFATVPKLLQLFIPTTGKYDKACVLHDFLYSNIEYMDFNDRRKADLYFLEALKDCKVGLIKRYIMYYFVRIFGKWFYKK